MSVRARQALIVAAGLAVAAVMVVLGLWQMQRSIDSGAAGVRARAEQAAVPLLDYLHADGTTDDIYGKQATVTGEYLPAQQLLVGGPDGALRILTAFRVADGRVVPVVRGLAPGAVAPAPPAGTRTESGIFLPGEGDSDAAAPAGGLASVRTPLIAQRWPPATMKIDRKRIVIVANSELKTPTPRSRTTPAALPICSRRAGSSATVRIMSAATSISGSAQRASAG